MIEIPRIPSLIADPVSKALPERIENRGADVAIHYAEGPKGATGGGSIDMLHWMKERDELAEIGGKRGLRFARFASSRLFAKPECPGRSPWDSVRLMAGS